jgi:hypothetical protein
MERATVSACDAIAAAWSCWSASAGRSKGRVGGWSEDLLGAGNVAGRGQVDGHSLGAGLIGVQQKLACPLEMSAPPACQPGGVW